MNLHCNGSTRGLVILIDSFNGSSCPSVFICCSLNDVGSCLTSNWDVDGGGGGGGFCI
jgi:hypothetical protein